MGYHPEGWFLAKLLGSIPYFRPRHEQTFTAEERAAWWRYHWLTAPLMLTIIGFATYGTYQLLLATVASVHPVEPGLLWLLPRADVWILPSLFFGLFAAIPVMCLQHYLLLGREQFVRYLAWGETVWPADAVRMNTFLAAVLLPLCGLFVWLLAGTYLAVDVAGVRFSTPFSTVESRHGNADVVQLVRIDSSKAILGQTVRRPVYEIRFRDGTVWNSRDATIAPWNHEAKDLMAILSARTGLPLTVEDPYPEAQK